MIHDKLISKIFALYCLTFYLLCSGNFSLLKHEASVCRCVFIILFISKGVCRNSVLTKIVLNIARFLLDYVN